MKLRFTPIRCRHATVCASTGGVTHRLKRHLADDRHVKLIDRIAAALSPTSRATEVLASPWADPSHLAHITLESLYGLVDTRPVTRSRAMRVAAVSKARRIIAPRIGTLPLQAVKAGRPAPAPAIITQPEDGLPRSVTITWTVDSLFFYGRAWWKVTRRGHDGFPMAVEWIPEGQATVTDGQLTAAYGKPVDPRDAIRFDAPDSGLLIDAAETIRRAVTLNRSAERAEQNPIPIVNLKNNGEDLSDDEIDAMIARFETKRANSAVGYTSRGLEVQTFGAPPENLLIDARKQIVLEIARHTGIPAHRLDVAIEGSSLTYTNRQSENQQLIDDVLAPYLTAVADRLSLDDITPHGTTVVFDTDELTTPPIGERMQSWATAIDAGIMTIDEVREREGLTPTPAPAREDTDQ